jgi:hypothetical protein
MFKTYIERSNLWKTEKIKEEIFEIWEKTYPDNCSEKFNKFYLELNRNIFNIKNKKLRGIFQNGNFNLDVINFSAKEVFTQLTNNQSKKLDFLKKVRFGENKINNSREIIDSSSIFTKFDFTMIITFLLILLSIFVMFIHFHLQIKYSNFTLIARKHDF